MSPNDHSETQPGIWLPDAFKTMSSVELTRLIPDRIQIALENLPSEDRSGHDLVELAQTLYGPETILDYPDVLTSVLSSLPERKKQELEHRVGSRDPDWILSNLAHGAIQRNLLSFFGLSTTSQKATRTSLPPVGRSELNPQYTLFPYQRQVVLDALNVLSAPVNPRALLHMPTGSGKTRTTAHAIASHLSTGNGRLVLWLANSSELLEQASDALATAWTILGDRQLPLLRYWSHATDDMNSINEGIIVAGLQKLHTRTKQDYEALWELGRNVTLVVVDEAHVALAPTYRRLIEHILRSNHRAGLLGLTATPGRSWLNRVEDSDLADMFGGPSGKVMPRVTGYPNIVRYLVEHEYLADTNFEPLIVGCDASTEYPNGSDNDDYSTERLLEIAHDAHYTSTALHAALELVKHRGHYRVLLFAATVSHARDLAACLRALDIAAEAITANTPASQRQEAIRRYRSLTGPPRVLCNYGVLTTGFDAPQTSGAVIARPTRSLVLYSQMAGRAIRGPKAGGNASADVLTIIDPRLPGFRDIADAFTHWEDVWTQ